MIGKIWKLLPQYSDDLTKQLLYNRGLKDKKEIDQFLNPKLSNYGKELDIPGIKKAQSRIKKAIKNQELILVFGDYDVDGICGCAILYKALTLLGAKVLPYIPHREREGYGLSNTGLEFARDSGATLVVTVDNGIVALQQAKFAKSLGLDLIITDHHTSLGKNPQAHSIVHSTKMCGTGVAWCLIRDLISKDLAFELLEFVSIATIADMMPMLGVNRALVVEGLKVLNRTKNLGLLALMRTSSLNPGEVGTYEIGHILSPRLNAIGRLEHAIDALRLLCTKDPHKANRLAKLLSDTNIKRQILTDQAIDEARQLIGTSKKNIHILRSKDWSPGIIGLIAARVCEEYFRPAIAISVGETHAKGSARSIDGVNIVEVIRKCSDLLIDVGGHKGAAGFSILNENIEKFTEKMEKLFDRVKFDDKAFNIEAEVEAKKLTKALVLEIEKFAPFGLGNPRPLLATSGMKIGDVRTVGGGKHLKMRADGIEAIAFGMGGYKDILKDGAIADLAYYLEINKFNGSEILQLKVRDLRINS